MDIEEAKALVEKYGIQIALNKNLGMWAVIINDMVCYVPRQNLENFSLEDFAQEIKLMLSFYVSVHGTQARELIYH